MAREQHVRKAERRRRYDSSRRRERAVDARERIVAATRELLIEKGYPKTTVAEIAARAGVSVDTIYKSYGGKAGLVKATWDATVAGDLEPVPVADRPPVRAIADEPDPRNKLRMYASLAVEVIDRLGPLLVALRGAWSTHPDLVALSQTLDQERLAGTGILADHLAQTGALARDHDPHDARDVIWTYISPDVYLLLVHDRGWTLERYERWLGDALISGVLRRSGP